MTTGKSKRVKSPRFSGKNRRFWTTLGVLGFIVGLGLAFSFMPPMYHVPEASDPVAETGDSAKDRKNLSDEHVRKEREKEIRKRFDEAVVMLHAGEFEYAMAALHRVLELRPKMPEAHINMGYALLGLKNHGAARDFFLGAIDLNPRQSNAFYGLAVAHEGLGEFPEALGAMRSYLHFPNTGEKLRIKARSAIWEWESKLAGSRRGAKPGEQPRASAKEDDHG